MKGKVRGGKVSDIMGNEGTGCRRNERRSRGSEGERGKGKYAA